MRRVFTSFPLIVWLGAVVSLSTVQADEQYQIVVYIRNPPDGALDAIDADAPNLLDKFANAAPGYETCRPGDKFQNHNGYNFLRGRELQVGGQCPASCAKSNSAYCRNIGCAKCGSSCSGTRELWGSLASNRKTKIKRDMNKELLQYCKGFVNCTVTSEILYVKPDGSTVPA